MKTEALIAALAADTKPVVPGAVGRRLALFGSLVAVVVLLAWLGPRPDLAQALVTSAFWTKAGYTAALALGGALLTTRLARPGGRAGSARWILAAAFIVVAALGGLAVAEAAPDQRAVIWFGHSWTLCPWRILVIATPVFVAVTLGLRRLAPTRLALAGAASGLFAGAVGATVYGIACTETSAAFLAVWYSLGVAICAGVGAILGRWLLRW
jgi:hypothetical protein